MIVFDGYYLAKGLEAGGAIGAGLLSFVMLPGVRHRLRRRYPRLVIGRRGLRVVMIFALWLMAAGFLLEIWNRMGPFGRG